MSILARTITLTLAIAVAACGSGDDAGTNPSTSAGTAGMASGGSNAGLAGSGVAGQTGGTPPTSGGQAGAAAIGGGGASAGGAGMGGTSAGGAAMGGSGGAAPAKLWECPPGPFPAPQVGTSETLCMGFNFAFNYLEGPTWVKADNALYFSNFNIYKGTGGNIVKYTLGGQCEVFIPDVGCNGLAVGVDGTLLGACQQSRSVQSYKLASKAASTLAATYMDKMLDTPNDIVVRSNGAVYFTNRTAELDGRPVGFGSGIFWIDPKGTLGLIHKGDDGNGIALSPDERTLYVNNVASWALDENGVPGMQGPKIVSGDGLAADCAGNLYMNSGQIVDPQGKSVGNFPGGTNMAFGGPDGTTLFVVSGGGNVRALHMNVPGIP
jgi:gluconolactonase